MKKDKVLSDNELIYLYRECQQVEALKLLYERYLEQMSVLITSMLKKMMNITYIDKTETNYQSSKIINEVIDTYDYLYNNTNNKISFKNIVRVSAQRKSMDEYRQYASNKHPEYYKLNSYDAIKFNNNSDIKYSPINMVVDSEDNLDEQLNQKEYNQFKIDLVLKVLDDNFSETSKQMFIDYYSFNSMTELAEKYHKSLSDTVYEIRKIKKKIKYIFKTDKRYIKLLDY